MLQIALNEKPYLRLCDLLKLVDLCESGGAAKHIIAAGEVKVDGQVELRKRAKILKGMMIEYKGETVKVV